MMVNLPCLMASCANFLRPTYSYTECWLSFLTGSCPKENTTASYSSCLYIWFYWPNRFTRTWFQWTLTLFCFVGLVANEVHLLLHLLRVSVPEPCSNPVLLKSSRVLDCVSLCVYAAWATCVFRLISIKSFFGSYVPPLFNIAYITLSILQAITIKDCIFFSGLLGLVV